MLDEKLAEFAGALFGDGCLSKYFVKSENRERYELAFTGSISDFAYYKELLQPTLIASFGVKGRLFLRGNSTRFHIKSKAVFNFFKQLGMPVGKKGARLEMPAEIFSNRNLALAFTRGLWNTDGSIYKRYSKKYPGHTRLYDKYLVMQLKLNSRKILEQVRDIFLSEGILCSAILPEKRAFVLRIGKQASIKRYLKLIGFSNKHHLNRIRSMAVNNV